MKIKEMDRLTKHFDLYFGQTDATVMHPIVKTSLHIDVLLYEPNDRYPFWKLATMGASDYKMPVKKPLLGNRNEYVLFVHPEIDMRDSAIACKYYRLLSEVALYPAMNRTFLTYGHSMEWKPEDGETVVGACLEFPQIIEDIGVLRCKLGLGKTAVCLQVIPLNRAELDQRMEVGPEAFSYFLYPDEGNGYYVRRFNEEKDM